MDTGKGKARGGQKLLIVLFLLVLFVPAVLGALSAVSGAPLDVPLKGYTEEHKMPALSLSAWESLRYSGLCSSALSTRPFS